MVLVVDESGSMNREHEWLLIMIPLLEQVLVQAGEIQTIAGRLSEFYSIAILYLSLLIHTIASGHFTLPLSLLIHSKVLVLVLGTGTVWLGLEVSESSRRTFHSGRRRAVFLCLRLSQSQVATNSAHFSLLTLPCIACRAQLLNAGLYEDGYQAIDFALKNIPFRDSPFIAKNVILITDEGRTPIPQGAGQPLYLLKVKRLL